MCVSVGGGLLPICLFTRQHGTWRGGERRQAGRALSGMASLPFQQQQLCLASVQALRME